MRLSKNYWGKFREISPLFTSSSYVPSSTTLPLFSTIILSQLFIVDNRCAMIIWVVSSNLSIVYYVNLLVLELFVRFLCLMLMLLNRAIIFLACVLELEQLIPAVFDLQTTACRKDQLLLRIHKAINLNLFQKSIHLFLNTKVCICNEIISINWFTGLNYVIFSCTCIIIF